MFREYISRDNGCPWGSSGMTSATWLYVPVEEVCIDELIATQYHLLPHALKTSFRRKPGADDYPHVIVWDGKMYLEDGHHRVARAKIGGNTHVDARILYL